MLRLHTSRRGKGTTKGDSNACRANHAHIITARKGGLQRRIRFHLPALKISHAAGSSSLKRREAPKHEPLGKKGARELIGLTFGDK